MANNHVCRDELTAEGAELPPRRNKSLLHHVGDVVVIGEHAAGVPEQPRAVAVDHDFEGRPVPQSRRAGKKSVASLSQVDCRAGR